MRMGQKASRLKFIGKTGHDDKEKRQSHFQRDVWSPYRRDIIS